MQIEAIGIVALLLGCIGWLAGPAFEIYVFTAASLFGAAGAVILTGLGSQNVPPGHLLLGFIAASSVFRRGTLRSAATAAAFPKAGFWLLLTAIYVVLSAVFLPRLFAGMTYVFAVTRSNVGTGIVSMPLAPTSGNITQTIYFLGDAVCFFIFYVYGRRPDLTVTIMRALLACAALNIVFALLDLATFWTHTQYLLSPIRNASYRLLQDATFGNYKRVVGSFTEASSFAYVTLGWFGFCARLWLAGVRTRVTGPLATASLAMIGLSTSSTGYAGAAGCVAGLFLVSLGRVLIRRVPRPMLAFVTVAPLLLATLVIGLRLNQPAWTMLSEVADQTLVDKLSSASGRERTRWNQQALVNFVETKGLGAGVGSVRASSLPVAALGNIGIVGSLTYGLFLLSVLMPRREGWRAAGPAACQSAARWACFAQLVGASVSSSFIDLALPFFVFAGLACARPAVAPVRHAAALEAAAAAVPSR